MYADGYALINNGTSKNMIHSKYCKRELSRRKHEWIEQYAHTAKPCGAAVDFMDSLGECACMNMTINTFNKRMLNIFHCFPIWK